MCHSYKINNWQKHCNYANSYNLKFHCNYIAN